ncbi:OmpA family protein [Roseomonas elaeocarpi]|uniref:OmpA family protein n=1 Tax=Roseomonas elaeocarpi TaxID=907779 RepID=A0ABV6JTV8_9PROT
MHSLRFAATILTLSLPALTVPALAQAQQISGFYVGAGAGANSVMDSSANLGGANGNLLREAGLSREIRQQWDWGWTGVGSIGYGLGNGLRFEIEGNYRRNNSDGTTIIGYRLPQHGGHRESYGVMANTYYDFDLTSVGISSRTVMPYVGAGIGYAWVKANDVFGGVQVRSPASVDVASVLDRLNINPSLANDAASLDVRQNGTEGRFAFQGIAGLAFPIGWVPGLSLTAEYRFFGTTAAHARTVVTGSAAGRTATLRSADIGYENFNHSILVGLRYGFNQPAPAVAAPPPPPAAGAMPATARTYLVFFNWNSTELTQVAHQVIEDAARNSRNGGTSRLEVSGHADRSGTETYNQQLSRRRAEVVAGELVRAGISRSEIVVQAYGESRPLVPTADGVREPQNRRVEIVLR